MVVDLDDFSEDNEREDLLFELRRANHKFKCTLFAVPGRGSLEFWQKWKAVSWVELAVHGWRHEKVDECIEWSEEQMLELMRDPLVESLFEKGFKSPGWQTSDGVYAALLKSGWWVADQHLEDHRRPAGLKTYFYEDGDDRWHGHIQNVCGNGLEERWDELVERVAKADSFQFCSEALSLSPHSDNSRKREVSA